MTRLSWLSRATASLLLCLEAVAVLLYFCIAVPLFSSGIGLEDEVAPRSKVLPHLMALGGLVMVGTNAFGVRELWRPLPGRPVVAATAGVQVLLLAYGTVSGDYLFSVFAAAVALPLLAAAVPGWRRHGGGRAVTDRAAPGRVPRRTP
ncbi:hypothetical protein [Kitasatospora sp. NPDC018619]|uniref:hypothetical protein n=1 Tax=unclassified Kitasatospora TaxID=2633591 RepID=UPI0037B122BE